ncbi:hypothetical protein [Hymenobacter perfusus]|uniref:Uncharacterized protein n=1 Tax=Hymenobacter perfusus TaxID=1236770 RepID=A0A3R9MIF3_9BACT|nr:hypothetical protein [Hymenobacter perfusus]RSK42989.1 hypothetical protein EI293_14465 [Hymenobacter perfusus]
MLALKRLVTILVMVFLLLALLVLLLPSVKSSFAGMAGSPESLYFGLLVAAVVLLGLQLITENLDSTLLRRDVAAREGKINELKARLYDHQLEQRPDRPLGAPRTGTTTLPEGYVATASAPIIPPTDAANQPLA